MMSLVYRLLTGLSLLFILLSPAHAIKCHTNDVTDSDGECSAPSLCEIFTQSGEVFQRCKPTFSFCNVGFLNKLYADPLGLRPYVYCCNTDFCNNEIIFNSLISPSPSPTVAVSTGSVVIVVSSSIVAGPQSSLSSSLSSVSSFSSTSSISSTSSSLSTGTALPSVTSSPNLEHTVSISHIVVTPASSNDVMESSTTGPSSTGSLPSYIIVVITVLSVAIFLFILALLTIVFVYFNPRHIVGVAVPTESEGTPTISTGSCDFSSNQELFDGTTSGSGAGLPLLVQRSIAAQVTTCQLIGKGRFGEVWLGSYKGDSVAVKIFHTKEEDSWKHEVEVYQTCLIRHPNILRFIAADNKDIGIATQLWLITEYCEMGSLYEVLVNEELHETMVLKLCLTAMSGLAHLHAEITGIEGKPAIAHRDLKSRNILVKRDYTCCIADLGLALRYDKVNDTVEEPPTKRVGTRRYLSPEILDDSMNVKNFDFFKRSDMYSFGLVLWEIARRGLCGGEAEEYQLPYFDSVTPDPSFEEMKKIVVFDKRRPPFPNRWSQSKVFAELAQLIEQCWHHNGEARLTALRLKKSLSNILPEKSTKPIEINEPNNQIQVSL